jgi:putative copper resistance protein D
MMIAAPTPSAKIAVRVALDLGELDIKVLEGWSTLWGATTDATSRRGRPPGSNRRHSTTARPVRATMPRMRALRLLRRSATVVAALAGAAALAGSVAAHGPVPAEAPTAATLLLGWTFEPLPTLGLLVVTGWWWWAVRRVNSLHPGNPVPRRRSVAFYGGIVALAFALLSGIARYDTALFSVHMVQHVLLMLVAAPLLALAAPITLILRLSSSETRHRWVLPVLHSRIVGFLAFPVVAWVVFTAMMWGVHFSPLFNASLEDPNIHDFEHLLFLTGALLFWWPAVALDPAPWRMGHPARVIYLLTQMTQNTFLAVVILDATDVLYPHYATLVRPWGLSAIDDQRLAAGIMWLAGDLIFLSAILLVVAGWMRAEARDEARSDRRADVELAQIRIRERRLAERLADERAEPGG